MTALATAPPAATQSTGAVQQLETNAAAAQPLSDVFIELIPRNPIETAVRALDGDMLQLMIFALVFGVAVSAATPAASARSASAVVSAIAAATTSSYSIRYGSVRGGCPPVCVQMMAASNSAGGVMGKMISLTSLAVAVAATGMARSEEGKLFRFTVKHSVFLAAVLGVIATIYAYANR